ncbi:hypothetical protein JXR93_00185 [bacterium]|nr:hypothetical protein [bacterium]
MKKIISILILISLSLFAKTSVVGVAPIENKGLKNYHSMIGDATDYFTATLLETNAVKIVTIDDKKMKEFTKQFTLQEIGVISSEEEAKEFGKFLGVDYMLYGSLAYLGEAFVLTMKAYNIETRELVFAKTVEFRQEKQYKVAVKNLANGIANKIAPNSVKESNINLNTDSRNFYDAAESFSIFIQNFKKQLPLIKGKIMSMPKAGVLEVKLTHTPSKTPNGIKLQATRKGISGVEYGGVLYLSINDKGGYEAKYLRTEVGKFEIGDDVSTELYSPKFAFGDFVDEAEGNDELSSKFKKIVVEQLQSLAGVKLITNDKIDSITKKITSPQERTKQLRKLYGDGIDYFIDGKFIGEPGARRIDFKIWSTYDGKEVFVIKFETKL